MGRWRVGSVGKRKSMHPTPSEQRPFVYLMKRTTRRTFPSLSSTVPSILRFHPSLSIRRYRTNPPVAKLSNLPFSSWIQPLILSNRAILNEDLSKIVEARSLSSFYPHDDIRDRGKGKAVEEGERRMKREREREREIRKFVPTEHQDLVAAHEFLVPAEQKRRGAWVPRDSARENLINENDDSRCAESARARILVIAAEYQNLARSRELRRA